MKINHIIYTATIALLLLGTGCKKWLDVQPGTVISEKNQFGSEAGFKDAMLGVYIKLSDARTYGRNTTFGFLDVIGQCYNIATANETYAQAVKLNYMDQKTRPFVDSIWYDMYANIGNVNQILSNLESSTVQFSGRYKNQLRGEALAMRAFLHFDLLRMFGTAPAVNANAKAIPYVTIFKVQIFPALTVNQVMDSCLKDLAAAEALLAEDKTIIRAYSNEDPYKSFTRHHMNYYAVKGLQARINLYRGNKPAALAAAMEVIGNQPANFPFTKPADITTTYNKDYTFAQEHLFAVFVSSLKAASDQHFLGTAQGGPAIFPLTDSHRGVLYEISAGGSTDLRYSNLFAPAGSAYATTKYSQINIIHTNSEMDYLRTLIPLIRVSEMFYIAAEASATPEEGTVFLNTIRTNRGLPALPLNQTEANLNNELRKEIKKECYAEGQNFFYFKRRNLPEINTLTATGKLIVPANAYQFPIPDAEIEYGDY